VAQINSVEDLDAAGLFPKGKPFCGNEIVLLVHLKQRAVLLHVDLCISPLFLFPLS
jgi:hypothetical protein